MPTTPLGLPSWIRAVLGTKVRVPFHESWARPQCTRNRPSGLTRKRSRDMSFRPPSGEGGLRVSSAGAAARNLSAPLPPDLSASRLPAGEQRPRSGHGVGAEAGRGEALGREAEVQVLRRRAGPGHRDQPARGSRLRQRAPRLEVRPKKSSRRMPALHEAATGTRQSRSWQRSLSAASAATTPIHWRRQPGFRKWTGAG